MKSGDGGAGKSAKDKELEAKVAELKEKLKEANASVENMKDQAEGVSKELRYLKKKRD